MIDQPLVTVVIPCWNAEATIGEAVESALSQTYPAVEVVVVDDGSTDGSLARIQSFGKRIRWESGPNRGGGAARNRGTAMASGEWIQFLDADDLLLPGKLEKQVPHALGAGKDALSFSHGRVEGDYPFLAAQYARRYSPDDDPVRFLLSGILPTPAPLHGRACLLEAGGFDESLPCAQEFDLHLRLVCGGMSLVQLPEPGFLVRRQPGSVSTDIPRIHRVMGRILTRARNLLVERGTLSPERNLSLAACMGRSASTLELAGLSTEAQALWKEARALDPEVETRIWTPPWRPLVRILGSARTTRLRRRARRALRLDREGE